MKYRSISQAKLNILITLVSQIVAGISGFLISRTLISAFGSVVYGLTTSITQFLSYISLLEGGIGPVARAEMYRPLADHDNYGISRVYYAVKRFFSTIGIICILYTLILSMAYSDLMGTNELSKEVLFLLVWVIGITVISKYLGGLTNLTLLVADQKQYIANLIITITAIINMILVVILVQLGCGILVVKLVSGLVFLVRPICYAVYVKRHYTLLKVGGTRSQLNQKWHGMGQHLALFLHTNTDVVLLTFFADIRLVAVYAVYTMVVSNIRLITVAVNGGMEAVFGKLIARGELDALRGAFIKYQLLITTASIILFGTTAVLIVPFVRLYTEGVTDVNYIQPVFAMILIFTEAFSCITHPCSALSVAANKLKQSSLGSYAEAIVNITLSLILIRWNPLVGIAIGTLAATLVKLIFYMSYSARRILGVKVRELMKNLIYTCLMLGVCALAGTRLATEHMITNYFTWAVWGVVSCVGVTVVTIFMNALIYPADLKVLVHALIRRRGKEPK